MVRLGGRLHQHRTRRESPIVWSFVNLLLRMILQFSSDKFNQNFLLNCGCAVWEEDSGTYYNPLEKHPSGRPVYGNSIYKFLKW